MSWFAVTYRYADNPGALDAHRLDHRAFLRGLADAGQIKASGPLADGTTALLIVEAADHAAVDQLLADDPFQQHGLVAEASVVQWRPIIGVFAS